MGRRKALTDRRGAGMADDREHTLCALRTSQRGGGATTADRLILRDFSTYFPYRNNNFVTIGNRNLTEQPEAVRHVRIVADDLWMRDPHPIRRALCGGSLHHLGILVHGIHVLRESGRNGRPGTLRYVRRDCPCGRAGVRCRAACRYGRRSRRRGLAVAEAEVLECLSGRFRGRMA